MLVIFYVYARPIEPKTEIQVEQVQKEYGGPHASSAKLLTLLLDQGKALCI
jgi:hypothetical protein